VVTFQMSAGCAVGSVVLLKDIK